MLRVEKLISAKRRWHKDSTLGTVMADEPRERPLLAPHPNALPAALRAELESMSGHDRSGVQIHTNSAFPAPVDALAYTQGRNIHLAPGQGHYHPHEDWHVAQQMTGRVQTTVDENCGALNDNATLEREADLMGRRASDAGTQAPRCVIGEEGAREKS